MQGEKLEGCLAVARRKVHRPHKKGGANQSKVNKVLESYRT